MRKKEREKFGEVKMPPHLVSKTSPRLKKEWRGIESCCERTGPPRGEGEKFSSMLCTDEESLRMGLDREKSGEIIDEGTYSSQVTTPGTVSNPMPDFGGSRREKGGEKT